MIEPAVGADPYRLTFKDWMEFPDDGRLYEVLGGELFGTPSPNVRHQAIARDLEFHLESFLRATGKGVMLHAPIGVRLTAEDVVEPDILVVLQAHADRIGEQVVSGAPDLVVEILSPGTAARDLGTKRALYERHGVREYWIVDPERSMVEVLRLESGRFTPARVFGAADRLRSALLPGLEIPLAEILG